MLPVMHSNVYQTEEEDQQKQIAGLEDEMSKIMSFLLEDLHLSAEARAAVDQLLLTERVQSKIQLLEVLRSRRLLKKVKKNEPG